MCAIAPARSSPTQLSSLVNQETKTQVTAQTNAQGAYQFTDVKIGQYQVTAQANGFDTSTTQPFTVTVNARQRVDVALKIGSNTETVTVDAAAALLETDSSERGQVIGTREVENLPLNGRAYADLAALVPGVRRNILENSTDSSRDASFNVNGQRSEFNNFLLDGLDNNAYGTSNQGFSNQAIPPSPDAISRVPRGDRQLQCRVWPLRRRGHQRQYSQRHESSFTARPTTIIRNTVFNAIGPFTPPTNPLTGKPQKPVLIRNQFGGTFGGPIWKDHTFFFGDYEGTRQVVHAVNQATVPTANQNGTSALAIANGGYTFLSGEQYRERHPRLHCSIRSPARPTPMASFPSAIPPSLPSPRASSRPFPQPNVPGDPFSNNYASLPADTINDDKGDIRVDQTFSQRTTAFVRYSQHQGKIASPPNIQGPAGGNSNGTCQYLQPADRRRRHPHLQPELDPRRPLCLHPHRRRQEPLRCESAQPDGRHPRSANRSRRRPQPQRAERQRLLAVRQPGQQSAIPEPVHLQPEDQLHADPRAQHL